MYSKHTRHNDIAIKHVTRLDNIVYRLGIAPTRRAARQLVTHKHIVLNGSVCNIPSVTLQVNDEVSVREKSKSMELINSSLSNNIQSIETK